MDAFHDTPLNKAHRHERKAEDHVKCGNYNDAIKCHMKAKECLLDAKKDSCSPAVLESIDAQILYHQNQEKMLAQKGLLLEQLAMEKRRREVAIREERASLAKAQAKAIVAQTKAKQVEEPKLDGGLETVIYRVVEEQDSLLALLNRKEADGAVNGEALDTSKYASGNKKPKDDKLVIEELRTNNQQLRELIRQLIDELDKLHTENKQLKSELVKLKEDNYFAELPPLETPNLLY